MRANDQDVVVELICRAGQLGECDFMAGIAALIVTYIGPPVIEFDPADVFDHVQSAGSHMFERPECRLRPQGSDSLSVPLIAIMRLDAIVRVSFMTFVAGMAAEILCPKVNSTENSDSAVYFAGHQRGS
jgi:hypothetical protein